MKESEVINNTAKTGSPVEAGYELVTDKKIDLARVLELGHDHRSGALVFFSGEVRNLNEGKEVLYLEYESHRSMAEKMIRAIVEEAKRKWDLNFALCIHREGRVELSECAVVVLTASVHRGEAYSANRYIIDRVKYEAPIWKREFFADGTSKWGKNCEHPPAFHEDHPGHEHHGHEHKHTHDEHIH